MRATAAQTELLQTNTGEFPLHDYRLRLAGREWSVLHTGAVLSREDEAHFLRDLKTLLPYGVALWPASIALAHDLASRGGALRGKRIIELGAGTGLPGIVAASFGALVVQTDRHEVAMSICERNAFRNAVPGIEHRLADWAAWEDASRYDLIIGSDILYGEATHPHLRRIFASSLAPGGRVLLSDPFRAMSLRLLESLAEEGWSVSIAKWTVGEEPTPRPIGVFELAPPRPEIS